MKRIVVLLAALALVAAGLYVPAAAQEAPPPVVPATVVLEDPFGDANALNDQGYGATIGFQGDNSTASDAGNASDIGKVWFTDDATSVSAHIQTELPPPGSQGLRYDVFSTPGEGEAAASALGCVRFVAIIAGVAQGQTTTWQGPNEAKVFDACNDGTNWFDNGVEAEVKVETLGDGTGLLTIKGPKTTSPFLATGQKLTQTTVGVRAAYGVSGTSAGAAVYIDNTKPGAEYAITGGGPTAPDPGKPTKPVPPVKPKPGKGKPKGCDKGNGKKKGCPKPPPAAACPAFTPAEAGKDKPTVTLTDAATEAAPLEQKVTLGQSTADLRVGAASHDAFNVQVDSAAAEAGFYALIEFPARNDYDLNMMYGDGSYAARSHAWNTIIEANDIEFPQIGPLSSTGHGGESTANSEKLVGIKVGDCSGWTIDVANYLGQGGEATVKLWLGEAKTDPQAQGAEPGA